MASSYAELVHGMSAAEVAAELEFAREMRSKSYHPEFWSERIEFLSNLEVSA